MLAPVGAERGPPGGSGGLESILAGTSAGQHDQAPHRLSRQLRAAGALLEKFDLARLSQRDAVDQLRHDVPSPEALAMQHLAEQGRISQGAGERDIGRHW
jgi:hypothetical protein